MRDQVARHLERARLAARLTVVGSVTDVAPVVTALARTMEKIHRDRGVAIEVRADARGALSRRAAGSGGDDRQPGRQCLQVGVVAGGDRGGARAPRCRRAPTRSCASWSTTTGAGCRRRSASRSRKRGRRLDETKPGSGLGLSIVVELAALYGGELKLGTAPTRGPARRTGAAGGLDPALPQEPPDFCPIPPVSIAHGASEFSPGVEWLQRAQSCRSICRHRGSRSPPAPAVRDWDRARRKTPAPCSAPGPARCSAPRLRAAAPAIGWQALRLAAGLGGLIGNRIGAALDDEDRQRAYAAQMDALERGPLGRAGVVEQSGFRPLRHRGAGPGLRRARPQLPLLHPHHLYRRPPQTARGTACRNPDGTWTRSAERWPKSRKCPQNKRI